jgi:transcription-repair coupling factor (superfamily II helicase)
MPFPGPLAGPGSEGLPSGTPGTPQGPENRPSCPQPRAGPCPYQPTGDQPKAIETLVAGLQTGKRFQTLLGITGSGKTFTMAATIERLGRPALVLSPNKTLAAQLYSELQASSSRTTRSSTSSATTTTTSPRPTSPRRHVHREGRQPQREHRAHAQQRDTFAARAPRRDDRRLGVVHLRPRQPRGLPGHGLPIAVGDSVQREELLRRLTQMQYARNNYDFRRGTFRARGDVIEIFPAYEDDRVLRVELFGDEVEALVEVDPLRGEVLRDLKQATIYPATHYVAPMERLLKGCEGIEQDSRHASSTEGQAASCSRRSGSNNARGTTSRCCAPPASATASRTTRASWTAARRARRRSRCSTTSPRTGSCSSTRAT